VVGETVISDIKISRISFHMFNKKFVRNDEKKCIDLTTNCGLTIAGLLNH
jgi:hypothetical protein